MISIDYQIPVNGLGTDFSQYDRPISYAEIYTNRFKNINGAAERRPGVEKFNQLAVSGQPNFTRIHEWVGNDGSESLLASDDLGNIWKFDASASATSSLTGKSHARLISGQSEDKLIFCNGIDRNFYTSDGGLTYKELYAVIVRGKAAAGSDQTTLIDSDISNWISSTLVANNDIIFNTTVSAYGIVTTVASSQLTHTKIGLGEASGYGNGSMQSPGDQYILIDHVDLNIIPDGNGGFDNIAVIASAENSGSISVSAISDWSKTEIRTGDFVYNTTIGSLHKVLSVTSGSSYLGIVAGAPVSAGQTVAFFKSAMPIASWVHVHYNRAYFIDSRNQKNVVITAPDDPEDVTTYQKTLEASSYSFGTQQPTGDSLLTLGTFLSYFVAAGKRNLYIYKGDTPIQDSSSTTIDFEPVGFYPNGVASRFGLSTNGTDLVHMTVDGLQAVNVGSDSNNTIQNNASLPIRQTLRSLIEMAADDDIQTTYYPRRSWLINKIGSNAYILNTSPSYNELGQMEVRGSWHLFTGKWAQMSHYFVRRNGDLLGAGTQGFLYKLDSSAATDDGTPVPTNLVMSWPRLEEPQKTVRIKAGRYIKPIFESGSGVDYTVTVQAGWDNFSNDTIVIPVTSEGAIGSFIIGTTPIGAGIYAQSTKYPLRWRGEQFRIGFQTESSAAPDIITGFTVYGDIAGRR